MAKKKSSSRSKVHPYLNLNLWKDGTLCFWRNKSGYNHDEYERRLADQISGERNLAAIENNVQR
jgi:hypothetical protein